MFTMFKIKASKKAGSNFYMQHLSANDYYSEKESVTGYWKGSLAEDFNLKNKKVDAEHFSAFQKNINPETGVKLTERNKAGSIRFYDFQCSAQKSVSVMSLWDSRLCDAHRRAVDFAMLEMERLAAVRVRKGASTATKDFAYTGNFVYAQFHHDSSRSLDPQLHAHNVIANATWDKVNKCYKALETGEICRAIRYCGKVYQNYLAHECKKLGYDIIKIYDTKGNIKGFEIDGVDEDILKMYSKRRKEIDAEIENFKKDKGRSPTFAEIASITRLTRDRKMTEITKKEVIAYQKEQLLPAEQIKLTTLVDKAKSNDTFNYMSDNEIKREFVKTIPSVYERVGVVRKDKIMAEVLNQNLGKAHLFRYSENFKDIERLRNLGGGTPNPYFTTEKIIKQEYFCIDSIDEQKNLFSPINPGFKAFENQTEFDYTEQIEVISGVLKSKDRFMLLRGVAGAGKTSTLQELCKGLKNEQIPSIQLIAPTNSAVDVLKGEGFDRAQTVAKFLLSESHRPAEGSLLIIDESGLNSLEEGVKLIQLSLENNYRVLFVGDSAQHSSVQAGDFFRLIEDYSQIDNFELSDIHRQQVLAYKAAVTDCSCWRFKEAFEKFDGIGFIKEGEAKYLSKAADSYFEFTDGGVNIQKCIAVAPTHAECEVFTEAIRDRLKASGRLADTGHAKEMFYTWSWTANKLNDINSYKVGQKLSFVRSTKGVASAGEMVTVEKKEDDYLHFSNGNKLYVKKASEHLIAGETREAEFCEGDLVQFSVNIKEKGIYNGSLGIVSQNTDEVILLNKAGKLGKTAKLNENFVGWRHGWVTTSHKAQGRTSENVVVAAETLTKKAFYVTMSRGKQKAILHCPDKEHLKNGLLKRNVNRVLAVEMNAQKKERDVKLEKKEARKVKASTMPNLDYLEPENRLALLRKHIAELASKALQLGKNVISRTVRMGKYPGIINEKTEIPVDKQNAMDLLANSRKKKHTTPNKGIEL